MAGRPPRALDTDVLKAALDVFCSQGIEAPLKSVGERVGISASAISQRFGSKHDLIFRALESAHLCPNPPVMTTSGQTFHECLADVGVFFAHFIIRNVLPAIELGQQLTASASGRMLELSTEPARAGFLKAAIALLPPENHHRTESARLLSAYLATLVGHLQLDQAAATRNFDELTLYAQQLAKDLTPLLIERHVKHGAIQ